MFSSIVGLVLACQLTNMQPTNYKAELSSLKNDRFKLTLTYQFYGAQFDYIYNLKASEIGLTGVDKRKDKVTVHSLKKSKQNYSLVIDSQEEGSLDMTCQVKK
jgi:hypothetical protein